MRAVLPIEIPVVFQIDDRLQVTDRNHVARLRPYTEDTDSKQPIWSPKPWSHDA